MYRAAFRAHSRIAFGTAAGGAIAFGTILARSQPLHADSGETATAWTAQPTVTATKKQTSTQEGAHIDAFKHPGSRQNASKPRTPAPPPQTKDHVDYDKSKQGTDGTASAWTTITAPLAAARNTFTNINLDINLAQIGDKITDYVLPAWVKGLPALISKLQDEMSMAPWSLSWEIWEDAHDPEKNPEIVWDAKVRVSSELCLEEQQYLAKRKIAVAKALAKYLDVAEKDVHPDDVPVIAMCGSGGGLRALIAGTSSYLSTQQAGLFDCTTYTAGVSGSCWLQTLYYSSIGQTDFSRLADHFKARLNVHLAFPPAALGLLSQAPTNKFLLGGVVEKLKGVPDAEFGVVDIYGMLLAARLLVPKGELSVSDWDLKVSNQRYFVDYGDKPLPIYTAVRHEIPEVEHDAREASASVERKREEAAYFQWFEWTPYEFFCEELNAGIPTWAMGRPFDAGSTLWRANGLALPEVRVPLMMGIWGSAFCATLSDYYKEIQPVLRGSGLGLGSSLDALLSDKDADMVKVHPLDPASIPNFALGLRDKLPPTCPESIHTASHLRLMDAGMSNNLPIYPLLRPGRNVDVIIAFDVSSDAPHANWIGVAGGYAKQRKIKGWPMGAGWPPRTEADAQITKELSQAEDSAKQTLNQAQVEDDLGHCTVWVGSTTESSVAPEDIPAARRVCSDLDVPEISRPDAGIAVIYFPLIPNDAVPGVDPQKSDYMSTWNFVYTPDEIDNVIALAKANFAEGEEQAKRTVRAVWQRKQEARLKMEKEARDMRARMRLRRGEPLGKTGWGDHFV